MHTFELLHTIKYSLDILNIHRIGKSGPLTCPDPGQTEKFNLYFLFHTSFWTLKWFYEGL